MTDDHRVPRSFTVAALVLGLLGGLSLVSVSTVFPPGVSPQLLLLLAAALLSENFALTLPAFNVSLAFPLIIAAVVLAGPAAGGMVASLCFTNLAELRERRPFQPILFNFGQLVVAACLAGVVYLWAGGRTLLTAGAFVPMSGSALPGTILTIMVAALTAYAVNIILTTYAVSSLRGHNPGAVAKAMLEYLPTQLALVFVGVLIAQVLAVSAVAFPLFLFPLVLARQIYQRSEDLRGVYLDTVRSLVGALEAKDPYTRGHSERVAGYARSLGVSSGMDERSLERLERSALLHDIGKLRLPASILTKPGALDEAEVLAMRQHPAVGGEMISRIPPLRGLEDGVRAHHERLDGSGYPSGIAGDHVPMTARILAVADAYDAMTTRRAYRDAMNREAALAELVAGAGTQFDSELVRLFIECSSADAHVIDEAQSLDGALSLRETAS